MRREQYANLNAMIDDYRTGGLNMREIARKYHHAYYSVQRTFHELGITRSKSEAAKLAWTLEKRRAMSLQQKGHPYRGGGRRVPRAIKRTRTQSIHDLALWCVRCKELTGRYPDGKQLARIIEEIRRWNGGEVHVEGVAG
jgi:hypothetical protein